MSPPVVTRLLQRTTRRLALTDAGQTYLSRVRSILQDIDEADAVASAHTTELAGLLRLHAPPVLASNVIAPLLAEFRRRYPKILLEIEVESVRSRLLKTSTSPCWVPTTALIPMWWRAR